MGETFKEKLEWLIRDAIRNGANTATMMVDLDNAWHDMFHNKFDLKEDE